MDKSDGHVCEDGDISETIPPAKDRIGMSICLL